MLDQAYGLAKKGDCDVFVIGSTNAGKSSFINSLLWWGWGRSKLPKPSKLELVLYFFWWDVAINRDLFVSHRVEEHVNRGTNTQHDLNPYSSCDGGWTHLVGDARGCTSRQHKQHSGLVRDQV